MAGWALARQVLPDLKLGAEIVHQTPDTKGGKASTGIDTYHLLAYLGPGLQNTAATSQYSWYASILFTF
jgi:hypothetical protein